MKGDGSFQISQKELNYDVRSWAIKILCGLGAMGLGLKLMGWSGVGLVLFWMGWSLIKSVFENE